MLEEGGSFGLLDVLEQLSQLLHFRHTRQL